MENSKDQIDGVLRVQRAAQPVPLIYDSPHSGRHYPADFNHACLPDALRRAEDNHVDELLDQSVNYGIHCLLADFPRTYIDVNRRADDIEPELLSEPWPTPLNPSDRAFSGIGLIRRLVRPGVPVYSTKLNIKIIEQRLENYYKPYHKTLQALLDDAHYHFGQVWHINWHSMPSTGHRGQPDFVIGDRDGTTCDPRLTAALRDFLKDLGYKVAVNSPYKGVELVRRYSNPAQGRHSLQLEIGKALYWDERRLMKISNFNVLKSDIDKISQFLTSYVSENLFNLAAD